MIVHQVYAQIFEEEVKNIIVCDNYELANYIARATYGDTAFAVDCLQYLCGIGDSYRNGKFYRVNKEGVETKILPFPTQEQQVHNLEVDNKASQRQIEDLTCMMSDVIGGVYNA